MKYEPSLPEHNDNVTAGSPLKDFVVLLGALVGIVLAVFLLLGALVDVAVDRLSPDAEAHLHEVFAEAPAKDKPASAEEARLQAMVDKLSACAGLRLATSVHLMKSDDANAVVFQGGRIYVMKGLLDQVKSENGLAFVLAHELGHITNRDHLRGMGRGIVLYAMSTMLTGDASALSGILEPALGVGQAGHSREREALADAVALRTLQCRYGHVSGATEFFEALKKEQGNGIPVLHAFESHPALQERIARIAQLTRQHGYRQGATVPLPKP